MLLPWLAMLCLLLLRPNRTAHAWGIWLPLLTVIAVELVLRSALDDFLPSQILDMFCQTAHALAFGIGSIWLAVPFLAGRSRFLNFLKMLPFQVVFSLLVCVGGQDWGEGGFDMLPVLIYLGIFVLVLTAALSLAGRSCRHHFNFARLSLWLLGWLAVCCVAISLPFAVFAIIETGGEVVMAFGVAILVSVAVQFIVLFPFLVLSFTSNFYRERLRQLLGQETPGAPPVITPLPTPASAT